MQIPHTRTKRVKHVDVEAVDALLLQRMKREAAISKEFKVFLSCSRAVISLQRWETFPSI